MQLMGPVKESLKAELLKLSVVMAYIAMKP